MKQLYDHFEIIGDFVLALDERNCSLLVSIVKWRGWFIKREGGSAQDVLFRMRRQPFKENCGTSKIAFSWKENIHLGRTRWVVLT